MGNVCVKDEQSPFCSTAATSSSRPRGVQDGARRSSQDRPFRVAAQRLGLELSEHAIMLDRSGTTGTPRVGGSVRTSSAILAFAIRVRAGSTTWVACQIKLTFGRRARRLHQDSACGGQAREDEAILRCGVLKPCNPSVRPPGSSEADRASADEIWFFRYRRAVARPGLGSGGRLHHGSLDDDALSDVLP